MAESKQARPDVRNEGDPRCIHLAGADGTGKTTQAKAILLWLQSHGVPARYVWLRHPRLLSVPFLVYARLRGYSWHEVVDGTDHGYWKFGSSWVMTKLFPWALLLDTFIVSLFGVYIPLLAGRTVVVDRFVIDILADVMVGLDDSRFDERFPGRLFLALLPPGTRIVVLDLDTETARQRSPELKGDRSQSARRQFYLGIADRQGLPVVSAAGSVEVVTAEVLQGVAGPRASGSDLYAVDVEANTAGISDPMSVPDQRA